MTGSPDDFEDRLRRVLDHASAQLQVTPGVWRGPSRARRRARVRRPGLGTAATAVASAVAILVAVVALALVGPGHGGGGGASAGGPLSPPPAAAFEPSLSSRERKYVLGTADQILGSDRACRGLGVPEVTHGSPSRSLTSGFSVLRQPANAPARVSASLARAAPGSWHGQELYINQLHRARTAFGDDFYVIPAGNVTLQRGVAERCLAEQATALKLRIAHLPAPQRAPILRAQRRYFRYLRYLAQHPEGVCALWTGPGGAGLDLAHSLVCATPADFGRWGVLADANAPSGRHGVFWTVVPDGVATVTLTFAPGRGIPPAPGGQRSAITVRPVANVVVAPEPRGAPFPARIVLRSSHGRVLKSVAVTPSMLTMCGFGC